MQFSELFEKPIDRVIDPVVKAGSIEHLANELDEYVITPELEMHLQIFYDEYNAPDSAANGAWISGFFGSGKSHLLKILAVMLEDKEVNGKKAMDYILPKVGHNSSLKGAMEVAREKHPSESVLFDINALATNEGRATSGGLLAAFYKAFNIHCGYFGGDQQFVAELEYDLDKAGHLEVFRESIVEETGKDWEAIRATSLVYKRQISKAFDKACGNEPGSTSDIVKDYKDSFEPSIKGFATRVGEYFEGKPAGFRINFFVDEVGQYIAKNPQLMIDLQTIAEQLDVITNGQSWVLVTSQENVEDVAGEMTKQSANDFSKIQARFKVKMQLSSQDAGNVIQRRLLAKKTSAVPPVEEIFDKNVDDFPVLFNFVDGSKDFKPYQNMEEFVSTYPFVPYQFPLFTMSIRGLSKFNYFTGSNHSVGTRSMLGVFQDVAIKLSQPGGSNEGSTEKETLATFDEMFEGLRNEIKSEEYGQISLAETQLDNPLAIRVLKALFLVKYVEDFKATPKNLRVLLFDSFEQNTANLQQQIVDALDELEHQVYVRKDPNTNEYEFLTDEEKDVENAIRSITLTNKDIDDCIGDLFDNAAGARRVEYKNGKFSHNYSYNLKINDMPQGMKRNDLTLNVITDYTSEGAFSIPPVEHKTLAVILQNANEFMNDVRTFVKTTKYVNQGTGAEKVRQSILQEKRERNFALGNKLRDDFKALLNDAVFNAGGADVTNAVTGVDSARLDSGMQELIRRSYTGLQQLKKSITDNDIYNDVMMPKSGIPGVSDEFIETVFSRIGLLSSAGTVTIGGDNATSLIPVFIKNEYGWPDEFVRDAIAQLYASGRIEIRKGGSLLEGAGLANALKKNVDMEKLVVSKVADVSPEQLAKIKQAFRALIGTNSKDNDAKSIAGELHEQLENMLETFRPAVSQASEYPFSAQYLEKLRLLEKASSDVHENWNWVTNPFPDRAEELANAKADLSKMKQFIDGSGMANRWREIKEFCASDIQEARALNLPIVSNEAIIGELFAIADDPDCYKSSRIPEASGTVRQIQGEIEQERTTLKDTAAKELDAYKESFKSAYDMDAVSSDDLDQFNSLFDIAAEALGSCEHVHQIKNFISDFKEKNGSALMALVTPASKPDDTAGPGTGGDTSDDPIPAPSAPVTIQLSELKAMGYSKPAISTVDEVDEYVAALREELVSEVRAGKTILK